MLQVRVWVGHLAKLCLFRYYPASHYCDLIHERVSLSGILIFVLRASISWWLWNARWNYNQLTLLKDGISQLLCVGFAIISKVWNILYIIIDKY